MKKTVTILLIICFTFLLGSCGTTGKNDSDTSLVAKDSQTQNAGLDTNDTGNKKNIALVMKTLTNPFFIAMEKGARKAEKEFGINLIVKTGAKETSIEQQIAIVEDLINSKVDAIVIAPGSSTDLIPSLKKAQDAGIKIVNIDNQLDPAYSKKMGLVNVPFISVDNENGAYLSAKYISNKIKKPTDAVIIEGIRGADNAEKRKAGAIKAFKENKNIRIVASESANWKIDEANLIITKIFRSNPDIGAVFCANDMMALGVLQYFNKSHRNNVLLAGFDDLAEADAAIQKGQMQVTINQQADVQGYTGVKYAYELLQGKSVPLKKIINVMVVTKKKQ